MSLCRLAVCQPTSGKQARHSGVDCFVASEPQLGGYNSVNPSRHGDSWESLECHPLSCRPGASLYVCSGWWIVELLRLPVVPAARRIRSPAYRARHFGVHRLVGSEVGLHRNYLGKGEITDCQPLYGGQARHSGVHCSCLRNLS